MSAPATHKNGGGPLSRSALEQPVASRRRPRRLTEVHVERRRQTLVKHAHDEAPIALTQSANRVSVALTREVEREDCVSLCGDNCLSLGFC